MINKNMKISIAAVPYFWEKEKYEVFYQALSKMNVDIVYLGETVCSKRRTMKFDDWLEIAEQLIQAGKQVVLSTLTLLEADSELNYLTKIAKQPNYLVEANDVAAIQVASQASRPFVVGSLINLYNNQSLKLYHKLGMKRWSIPVELGKDDLKEMIPAAKKLNVELEHQAFGRMQLASSARCFTARHHQLPKDHCQFKCLEDEQGILVKTQEGDSFAQINGIQTQSAKVTHLLNEWQDLKQAGIDILRVVPVSAADTLLVVEQLCKILEISAKNDEEKNLKFNLNALNEQYGYCNGYWHQIEGMSFNE